VPSIQDATQWVGPLTLFLLPLLTYGVVTAFGVAPVLAAGAALARRVDRRFRVA